MFGIGFGELLFLAVLALIVFGPRRLPEMARTVGRFLSQVRQASKGIDQEVRGWMQGIEPPQTWLQDDPAARRHRPPPLPPAPGEATGSADKPDQAPPAPLG